MRVWDIHPGYLNRESLLGEHREVHALFSVIGGGTRGYARHPETLRWRACMGALVLRHDLIVQEMLLRGYRHMSPSPAEEASPWPGAYVNHPHEQFVILKGKYSTKPQGRIPLPGNAQQLWAQHKYSILARDPDLYRHIGPEAAGTKTPVYFQELARVLAEALRTPPAQGRLMNALLHMWGYVSGLDPARPRPPGTPVELMGEIRERAVLYGVRYLMESTALSDLACWARRQEGAGLPHTHSEH